MEDDTTPTPDGSVKLHQLCDSCTQFVHGSGLLEASEDSFHTCLEKIDAYKLCTIAHLKEMDGVCHLCTKIHYQLILWQRTSRYKKRFSMNDESFSKEWVILTGGSYIHAALGFLEISVRKYRWASHPKRINVKFYTETEKNVFGAYIHSSHVPFRAEHHVTRMQEWLQKCMSTHQKCKAPIIAKIVRPSRVLEVGNFPGDKVTLRCDCSKSTGFRYLALSHMWGSDPSHQVRLIESRLQEFKAEVPWNEMSVIFKEAIRITRAIGYQYLWIDSLCIIQDSPSDWNNEAVRMADVYGNADCTIAYLFPPTDIRTKPRNNLQVLTPCVVRQVNQKYTGLYLQILDSNLRSSCDWLSRENWPLFSRAWALQEHVLSPRTVFVGHHNLIWECSEESCDELTGRLKDFDMHLSKKQLLELRLKIDYEDPARTANDFMDNWETLVHHYRERKLTKAEDRIMAFAGVAQAMQRANGMTYLAGSWREIFPLCMMWALRPSTDGRGSSKLNYGALEVEEPVVHDVPSWSWFSLPIYRAWNIWYMCKSMDKDDFRFNAGLSSVQKSKDQKKDTLDSVFYDFSGLSMTIHALIFLAEGREFSNNRSQTGSFHEHIYVQFREPISKTSVDFFPDQPLNHNITGDVTLVLLQEGHSDGVSRVLGGLVLLPSHGNATYKRLGLWHVQFGLIDEADSLFEGLVGARMETITLV